MTETNTGLARTTATFEPQTMQEAMALASQLAQSSLIPVHLRGKPADVLVTLITGRELGLSPMQAIRGMYVVSGKAAMSADLMVALAVRHGDVCEYFRIVESTSDHATYETKRRGAEPTRLSFTLAQARAAQLLGNQTWSKYPDAMLRARCASALARAVYPDLLAGVYDADSGELPREREERAAPGGPVIEKKRTSARVEEITTTPGPDATLARDLTASLAATAMTRGPVVAEAFAAGIAPGAANAREVLEADWLARVKKKVAAHVPMWWDADFTDLAERVARGEDEDEAIEAIDAIKETRLAPNPWAEPPPSVAFDVLATRCRLGFKHIKEADNWAKKHKTEIEEKLSEEERAQLRALYRVAREAVAPQGPPPPSDADAPAEPGAAG